METTPYKLIAPACRLLTPGVRSGHVFVEVRAPAGAGGHRHGAVDDLRPVGDELVLPRHVVHVYFHDADVGQYGAQARADERRQVAVVVVGSNVVLI